MRWSSALAIYILFWSFAVFVVLPFGVRTTDEAGGERIPGQADSAPHEFNARKLILRTTVVATVAFALFLLNYIYGWVTPATIDIFGRMDAVAA